MQTTTHTRDIPNWKRNLFLSPRTHREAETVLKWTSRGSDGRLLSVDYTVAMELLVASRISGFAPRTAAEIARLCWVFVKEQPSA